MTTNLTMNDTILPNSKKIMKFKRLNPAAVVKESELVNDAANCKKYETFNNTQKINILMDLRAGLTEICKIEIEEKESFVEDLLELLPAVELKEYNKLLARVLAKHIDAFICSPKILTQWRKKIKGWIHNTGKPENRGNPLVPFEKLDNFRNEVIRILKNLPFRCFPLLRQNILKVLERFHKEDEVFNGPQPFNINVCSKHWWFNFMQRNQDIKDMWEAIPLEREGKKLKAHAQKQKEDQEGLKIEDDEEGKDNNAAVKTSSLHMVDPIFSGPSFGLPHSQPTMPPMPTMPTMSSMPRLFGPADGKDLLGARMPDPYFVSMKALEFLFATRDAIQRGANDNNMNTILNNVQQSMTMMTCLTSGMKTEEDNVKEEIHVKAPPFFEKCEKEEEMTDSTKVSPASQGVKTEETRVKIEVEPLPTTTDSDSANICPGDL